METKVVRGGRPHEDAPQREPLCIDGVEVYEHHGKDMAVHGEQLGMHREYCLCYKCPAFHDTVECPTAAAVFKNCVELGIVTPVMECNRLARMLKA